MSAASLPSIAFLSSADFVSELLEFIIQENLASVKMVWTNPPKPKGRGQQLIQNKIAIIAQKYHLPLIQTDAINNQENKNRLHSLACDFALIIAYGKILKKDFFSLPDYGSFNVHFSLLPKYRGAAPIQAAILNDDIASGISIQKINEKMDAGDLSLSKPFNITNLNAKDVFQQATQTTKILLKEFFADIPKTLTHLTQQDHLNATYCTKIDKRDGLLNKNDTANIVYQKFLAYTTWPGLYFFIGEKKIIITQMTKSKTNPSFANVSASLIAPSFAT